MGVSYRKGPTFGAVIAEERKSHRPVSGSWQSRGGGCLEAFPLPREHEPGCSWLLAGASNLAAAGDLDAWHSRAAGLWPASPISPPFGAQRPSPAQPLL